MRGCVHCGNDIPITIVNRCSDGSDAEFEFLIQEAPPLVTHPVDLLDESGPIGDGEGCSRFEIDSVEVVLEFLGWHGGKEDSAHGGAVGGQAGTHGQPDRHDPVGGSAGNIDDVIAIEHTGRTRLVQLLGEALKMVLRDVRHRESGEIGVTQLQDARPKAEQAPLLSDIAQMFQRDEESPCGCPGHAGGLRDLRQGEGGMLPREGADDREAPLEGLDELGRAFLSGTHAQSVGDLVRNTNTMSQAELFLPKSLTGRHPLGTLCSVSELVYAMRTYGGMMGKPAAGGGVEKSSYTTVFGSLDTYSKGGVELVNDDARHYAFSNVFEVASKFGAWQKIAVAKNFEYVLEAVRAEGVSEWRTCAHDEFAVCLDGEVTVEFVKLDSSPLAPEAEGSVALDGEPVGQAMGKAHLKRGHQALLPAGSAYRFTATKPGVLLMQTIAGPDTQFRWAEICQTS